MKFKSPKSEDVDTNIAGSNRVLERTSMWTDEDWQCLCRAEARGRNKSLLYMLAAELDDAVPTLYWALETGFEPKEERRMRKDRPWQKCDFAVREAHRHSFGYLSKLSHSLYPPSTFIWLDERT